MKSTFLLALSSTLFAFAPAAHAAQADISNIVVVAQDSGPDTFHQGGCSATSFPRRWSTAAMTQRNSWEAKGLYDFLAHEEWFHNNSTADRKSDDSLMSLTPAATQLNQPAERPAP